MGKRDESGKCMSESDVSRRKGNKQVKRRSLTLILNDFATCGFTHCRGAIPIPRNAWGSSDEVGLVVVVLV